MSDLCKQMLHLELNDDNAPQGSNNDSEGAACVVTHENVQQYPINISMGHFEFTKLLGKGTYGYVYLVRKLTGYDFNKRYALKVLKKSAMKGKEKDTAHTRTERNIMATVKHPFVVEMLYSFQTHDKVFMVLEYMSGGDLYTLLYYKKIISEEYASFYASELILALGHLHKLGIIHRDVKPENVVIDASGHVKLTDFGLSKENMRDGDITYTNCGSMPYVAPEILHEIGHNKSVDWWCLGALMYRMLTGERPFLAHTLEETIENIISRNVSFPMFLSCEVRDLMRSLLKRMACHRLGNGKDDAIEIQSHEFFRNTNWSHVLAKQVKPPFKPLFDVDGQFKEYEEESFIFLNSSPPKEDDFYFEGFSYEAPSVLEEAQREQTPKPRKWYQRRRKGKARN